MQRVLMVPLVLATAVVAAPARVAADPGHERPRITVMRWQDAPVTAAAGECTDEDEVCEDEFLIVKAHDPDSSITEVQVWFDEEGGTAPFVMAHTYCVQGNEPGTPARLKLGVSYPEPGEYVVAAVAYSHHECRGHEKGDGHAQRHSPVKRLVTEVEAPPEE